LKSFVDKEKLDKEEIDQLKWTIVELENAIDGLKARINELETLLA